MELRREPALILGTIAALVQMLSAFATDWSPEQQGLINAAAAAVAGLITAVMVHTDRLAPAILGAVQAVLALGLGFGLDLPADQQSVIMAFVAAVVAMFVRTQVTAPAERTVLTR